ncbi:DUF3618 domain-containing protein, partial [Actinoplanes sp. NPDC051633]|uniref:DUF3618 domain-containing protein n=1 Tax=Actinoplanes sp. NPDC051633 TaxID=3155670 RepID=UPI003438BDB1
MAEEPDRLRQDIEQTRASLTRDVDALAEKTSPKRVAQRRWTSVKEKVMGTPNQAKHQASSAVDTVQDKASSAASAVQDKASSAASTVQDKASSAASTAADTVREAPHTVAQQTRGNPLAAGIIAFGAGLLAASLIPVT